MAVNIITWLWGNKYGGYDVVRLAKACRKHFRGDHRFHLFTDRPGAGYPPIVAVHPISDPALCGRACLCRLRMFDPVWQQGYNFDGQIISLDLDLVITGELDPLFADDATFKILHGANAANPNPFNASVMMLRSGEHAAVWNEFSYEALLQTRFYEFPDDQGWIWHKLPQADGWQVGSASGIYAFQKPGWPIGKVELPADARIVTFIGHRKPQQFPQVPWIRKYWTAVA
jgi:hypothetical protein